MTRKVRLLMLGGVVLVTIIMTRRPMQTQLQSNSRFANPPILKTWVSTVLFDDKRTDVLHCITGKVVGVRPKNVAMIDVHQLSSGDDNELDSHRRVSFNKIFQNKVWGKNPKVKFSGSGKYILYNKYFLKFYSIPLTVTLSLTLTLTLNLILTVTLTQCLF